MVDTELYIQQLTYELRKKEEKIHNLCVENALLYLEHPGLVFCKHCKYKPIKNESNRGPNYYAPSDIAEDKCPLICDDPYHTQYFGDYFSCKHGERADGH